VGTVEFRINGNIVSHITYRNLGALDEGTDDLCTYHYASCDVNKGEVKTGNVLHYREDGVQELVATIIADSGRSKSERG
jgi:hypothetical protein